MKQTTDGSDFREQWQGERGILEGETYLDQIEDLISADTDRSLMLKVLRLLCLQSLTAGGVRSNRLDNIRRLVAHTYGFEQLFTIHNLERAGALLHRPLILYHINLVMHTHKWRTLNICLGLLRRKDVMLVETASPWQSLRRTMRLIDERVNVVRPDDIAYVSAGKKTSIYKNVISNITS